jgi:hypothetical protein
MTPITYLIQGSQKIQINKLDAKSGTFGMLTPGETSQTNIVQLNVPEIAGITNIRLALIDTGSIVFSNTRFGVETRGYIDTNVAPSEFFQGVSDKSENSPYNIAINNLNRFNSQYIYINVVVPNDDEFTSGTVRYQWLFDYA